MGAVHGFRPDANGDGRISQKEFKAMKKLGLDVNYLDKDGNGKVDKDVKSKANCVFSGDEERIYDKANIEGNKSIITSTSIVNYSNGDKLAIPADEIEVSANQILGFYKSAKEDE